jgi:hypothetical protein
MRQVHPASAARRAKSAALAAEGDELVVAALAAAQPQEAVGQDAAFEEGVELVLDELRLLSAGSVFGLGEEGRGVLLNQAVQHGLLGAVTGCELAPAKVGPARAKARAAAACVRHVLHRGDRWMQRRLPG